MVNKLSSKTSFVDHSFLSNAKTTLISLFAETNPELKLRIYALKSEKSELKSLALLEQENKAIDKKANCRRRIGFIGKSF
jgi:hypothetical protein